ncbi:MAG: hypothetical protein ACOH5I_26375 [Oligoflexus sp.]
MKRREILSGTFSGAVALVAGAALLLKPEKAQSQDAAAAAVLFAERLKAIYDEWIKEYQEYAKKVGEYKNEITGAIKPIKDLSEQRDVLLKQYKWCKDKFNQLLGFANDPLGGTAPNLQRESVPIFQALDVFVDGIEKLFRSPEIEKSKKSEIARLAEIKSHHALSRNSLVQQRKIINAMKKTAGQTASNDKSAAEIFTSQSGVVVVEQLQTIAEKLDQLVAFQDFILMREYQEYFPEFEEFTKAHLARTKERYTAGEANIPMPTQKPSTPKKGK